jgi:hypothetical protein
MANSFKPGNLARRLSQDFQALEPLGKRLGKTYFKRLETG